MEEEYDNHDDKTGGKKGPRGNTESTAELPYFRVGDMVFIQEHGFPGVSNPEGAAFVKRRYDDGRGNHVYDVKYVVGGIAKGVFAEYVTTHKFL